MITPVKKLIAALALLITLQLQEELLDDVTAKTYAGSSL